MSVSSSSEGGNLAITVAAISVMNAAFGLCSCGITAIVLADCCFFGWAIGFDVEVNTEGHVDEVGGGEFCR